MAVSEETRHTLYRRLEEVLGHEEATTLMELVPPVGWADVATKQDLDHLAEVIRLELRAGLAGGRTEMGELRTELRTEMGELRTELRTEMGELRTEMGELRTELRTEMGELRTELRTEMGELRTEMVALQATFQRELRVQLLAIGAFNLSLFGAAVALVGM